MPYKCLYLEAETDFASFHYTLTGHMHTASRHKLRLHAFGSIFWKIPLNLRPRKPGVVVDLNVKHILVTKNKNEEFK